MQRRCLFQQSKVGRLRAVCSRAGHLTMAANLGDHTRRNTVVASTHRKAAAIFVGFVEQNGIAAAKSQNENNRPTPARPLYGDFVSPTRNPRCVVWQRMRSRPDATTILRVRLHCPYKRL